MLLAIDRSLAFFKSRRLNEMVRFGMRQNKKPSCFPEGPCIKKSKTILFPF
jgi:hypothetical protein